MSREILKKVKRVVVKAGTSNLTDETSRLDLTKVEHLVSQLMELKQLGKEPILVSSGAIGAGVGRINLPKRPVEMPQLQAVAAIGQGILMQTYESYFDRYGQPIAQLLLTKDDFTNPSRYRNLKSTLTTLIDWGVIPVINENDTVAIEEIKVGDNDTLAAYVAYGIDADLLLILTDVDGLYVKDPARSDGGDPVSVIEEVTLEVESWASRAGKGFGGMFTKIQAAKKLADNGIPTVIANGMRIDIMRKVLEGDDVGTIFLPKKA